jgi:hypothetical protein
MVYDFPVRWQRAYRWALEELCMPAAYVCETSCPEQGSVLVCLRSISGFRVVWLYMHTGEGQRNFNTFCARKCGILKIKPHYLNVLLEEET